MSDKATSARTAAMTGEAREKYRVERERRFNPQGIGQYEPFGSASAPSRLGSPAGSTSVHSDAREVSEVIVVGGGIAGIVAAVRLRQAGVHDVRIVDKADDLGGTWHSNRYPGVRCDVESYIYMPLLEETGYVPSEKYAAGDEIQRHLVSTAREFGLYNRAILNCAVTGLRWMEGERIWEVSTAVRPLFARFVIHAGGLFTVPKVPRLPGIERFKGKVFHTSKWDYSYTGKDLSLLGAQRVGIIGSGATAIQCIPPLAVASKQLYVFQRTPSSVSPRNNRATDLPWAASLPRGWQHERMMNFAKCASGIRCEVDLVDDGWTQMMRRVGNYFTEDSHLSPDALATALEQHDFEYMEAVRGRVATAVLDARTAELLKPYYRAFCKRPCFSDEYLPTFNRTNVELVDVSGENRITAFDENGLLAGTRSYELDCIVFATGFSIGTGVSDRCGFDPIGAADQKLSAKWCAGPVTLHGCMSHGFPNLFFLGAIQTGASSNYTHMMYEQVTHIVATIQICRESGHACVEPTTTAEARWVRTVRESAKGNVAFLRECTPGYFNQEGNPNDPNALISSQYGGSLLEFRAMLEEWRRVHNRSDLAFR